MAIFSIIPWRRHFTPKHNVNRKVNVWEACVAWLFSDSRGGRGRGSFVLCLRETNEVFYSQGEKRNKLSLGEYWKPKKRVENISKCFRFFHPQRFFFYFVFYTYVLLFICKYSFSLSFIFDEFKAGLEFPSRVTFYVQRMIRFSVAWRP